jgi:membrane protein DedA with SNARE-associated domain
MNSSISLASAGIVMEIIDNITSWIATYGYPAVFVAALLETIFPVIPSELIFPLVGYLIVLGVKYFRRKRINK